MPLLNASVRLPLKPPPLIREHRLYQVDWLMCFYGYQISEITTAEQPNLDLDIDPKLSWALRNRSFFPIDINKAALEVLWQKNTEENSLFSSYAPLPKKTTPLSVPVAFVKIAETASCHRSGDQWPLLYSLLWRLTHGERSLLSISSDPEVHRLQSMVKHISRACHKMHAFVRFRKIGEDPDTGREQFVSWFEPDHKILRLNASFFRKRFTNMNWSILTPDECMHWDGKQIRYTAGVNKSQAPDSDTLEDLWRSYYKSIFNVARVKVKAMQSEMPKKYWKNLPEADLIESLIIESPRRLNDMLHCEPSPEKPAPQSDYLQRLKELPCDSR